MFCDRYGELSVNKDLSKFSVDFSGGELVELQSNLAAGGRAMELSELRHQFIASSPVRRRIRLIESNAKCRYLSWWSFSPTWRPGAGP
jgi:hypothetical protein